MISASPDYFVAFGSSEALGCHNYGQGARGFGGGSVGFLQTRRHRNVGDRAGFGARPPSGGSVARRQHRVIPQPWRLSPLWNVSGTPAVFKPTEIHRNAALGWCRDLREPVWSHSRSQTTRHRPRPSAIAGAIFPGQPLPSHPKAGIFTSTATRQGSADAWASAPTRRQSSQSKSLSSDPLHQSDLRTGRRGARARRCGVVTPDAAPNEVPV